MYLSGESSVGDSLSKMSRLALILSSSAASYNVSDIFSHVTVKVENVSG